MSGQQTGRVPSRGRQTGRDMVVSLGLVGAVLGVWLWFSHPRTPDAVKEVDWWPAAQSAASAAPYEVLAPSQALPWSATSARAEPQPDGTLVWRVGFLTPAGDYAAVLQRGVFPEQAVGSVKDWVSAETRDGAGGEEVVIAGRTWTRTVGDPQPDERRSLVASQAGTVTVVTGSASWDELEALAAGLEPVAR